MTDLVQGDVFKTKNGSLWILPNGPNTAPVYLGCHDLDELTESLGGIDTLIQVFDHKHGGWRILGDTESAPEMVESTITTYVAKTADYLESIKNCRFPLVVNQYECGDPDVFDNYIRSFGVRKTKITERGLTGLVHRTEDSASEQSFGVQAWPPVYRLFRPTSTRVTSAEAQNLLGINACGDVRCADGCGAAQNACTVLWQVSAAAGGASANVYYSLDAGVTWTATAADPFGVAENIAGPACFQISSTVTRILVARATTDAGNPAEVAYSDDTGATWTTVNVGTTNAEFCVSSQALFAYDQYNIWMGSSGGRIYFSNNGGVTWAVSDTGTIAANVRSIHALDQNRVFACGDGDDIAFSVNHAGLRTWTAEATGSAAQLNTIHMVSANRIWCGTATGLLYYSVDGGANWTARAFSGSGAGATIKVAFVDELNGWLVHNTAAPVGRYLRTRNGGYSWELFTTPFVNAGLTDFVPCSENELWAVGNVSAGTAVCMHAA